jgi:hypothetical protein
MIVKSRQDFMRENPDNVVLAEALYKAYLEGIRAEVKGLLHKGVMKVEFTKADGSNRVMEATLMEGLLPVMEINPDEAQEDKPVRKVNVNTQRVFDMGVKDFRAFNYDRLKSYEMLV